VNTVITAALTQLLKKNKNHKLTLCIWSGCQTVILKMHSLLMEGQRLFVGVTFKTNIALERFPNRVCLLKMKVRWRYTKEKIFILLFICFYPFLDKPYSSTYISSDL